MELLELQQRLQAALRHVACSSGDADAEAGEALVELLPALSSSNREQQQEQQQQRGADAAVRAVLPLALRSLLLELADEAHAAGIPSLRFVAGRASAPSLPRVLQAALLCCERGVLDAGQVISALDELAGVMTTSECLDIVAWLEGHAALLAAPNPGTMQQLTRLCNSILKRLGRSDVLSKARLLLLVAGVAPLFDRSGLNLMGAFAPPHAPKPEPLEPGAVDSTGRPVDVILYNAFWALQAPLQNPASVVVSLDAWAGFRQGLSSVLEALARAPATVPATRASTASASGQPGVLPGHSAAEAAGPMDATGSAEDTAVADGEYDAAARRAAAGGDSGGGAGGAQAYLSSWKLFGLQLTDSAFRRDFLTQVLIMLRTLLVPGKGGGFPRDTMLKPKQRLEALALEREVYKALEATPHKGKEFVRALRNVLEREMSWVGWKAGDKRFVVPAGSQRAAPPSGAAVSAGCVDWSRKRLSPPLSEALASAEAEAAARADKARADVAEGLALRREVELSGRTYDTQGDDGERPDAKRRRYVKLLDNGSAITHWAQARIADRALADRPLLHALHLQQQEQYPRLEAVCAQAVREMDPDSAIETQYRRVYADSLYRWRIGRLLAARQPEVDGLEKPEVIEDAVCRLLPELLSPALREKRAAEEAAAKAAAAERGKAGVAGKRGAAARPPVPAPQLRRVTPPGELASAAAAAAAAASEAGGDQEGTAPVAAAAATAAGEQQQPCDGDGNVREDEGDGGDGDGGAAADVTADDDEGGGGGGGGEGAATAAVEGDTEMPAADAAD